MRYFGVWEKVARELSINVEDGKLTLYLRRILLAEFKLIRRSVARKSELDESVKYIIIPNDLSDEEVVGELTSRMARNRFAIIIERLFVMKESKNNKPWPDYKELIEECKINLLNREYNIKIEPSFINNVLILDYDIVILCRYLVSVIPGSPSNIFSKWKTSLLNNIIDQLQNELAEMVKDYKSFQYVVSEIIDNVHSKVGFNDKVIFYHYILRYDIRMIRSAVLFYSYVIQGYSRKDAGNKTRKVFRDYDYADICMGLECSQHFYSFSYAMITNNMERRTHDRLLLLEKHRYTEDEQDENGYNLSYLKNLTTDRPTVARAVTNRSVLKMFASNQDKYSKTHIKHIDFTISQTNNGKWDNVEYSIVELKDMQSENKEIVKMLYKSTKDYARVVEFDVADNKETSTD